MWHIESSEAQKRNLLDFSHSSIKLTMLSNVCCQKFNFARLRVIGIFKNLKIVPEVFLNFFSMCIFSDLSKLIDRLKR